MTKYSGKESGSFLSQLTLRQFRNYEAVSLSFSPGFNVFAGANGQGKTNILEAIAYLALLRSFRTNQAAPLKRYGSDHFYIRGKLKEIGHDETRVRDIAVGYGEKRQFSIGGARIEKASEFVNQFLCVPLVPEDIDLIKGAPSVRRRFANVALTQIYERYLQDFQRFTLCLRYRNTMLKQTGRYSAAALRAYDAVLTAHGARIMAMRKEFVSELNSALYEISGPFLGRDTRVLTIQYRPNLRSAASEGITELQLKDVYARALEKTERRDREEGRTTVGPQRDDIAFLLGGRALSTFGSEGECRLACLAVRLACCQVICLQPGKDSISLLVDDVYGELDPVRRAAFFELIRQFGQVFLTTTAIPEEVSEGADVVYGVSQGRTERMHG